MARGRYTSDATDLNLLPDKTKATIPLRARATYNFQDVDDLLTNELQESAPRKKAAVPRSVPDTPPVRTPRVVEEKKPSFFTRQPHLLPLVLCLIVSVLLISVLLSAGIANRPWVGQLLNIDGGQVYDVQVGGNLALTWQNEEPLDPKTPIPEPVQDDEHSVLGEPTVTAEFINQVLAAYDSPARGKGQALYNLGIQYGIDPVFALAFFMHESSFGKAGMATKTLSLGNLRCIPDHRCEENFAWFDSWEDGFKAWFELIRNLYVAQWGRVTVAQIIPKYAPAADNNNELAYINSVNHAVDTWRSDTIFVSG